MKLITILSLISLILIFTNFNIMAIYIQLIFSELGFPQLEDNIEFLNDLMPQEKKERGSKTNFKKKSRITKNMEKEKIISNSKKRKIKEDGIGIKRKSKSKLGNKKKSKSKISPNVQMKKSSSFQAMTSSGKLLFNSK